MSSDFAKIQPGHALLERQLRVGSTCPPDRKAVIQGDERLKGTLRQPDLRD